MFYPIAIERRDSHTAHGIRVPDLPGCFSAADNYQDAVDMAIEAIELHLEGLVEDGEQIPLPSDIGTYMDNPEYEGVTWALAPVDVNRYLGKTEKINVTLPSRLIHMIDEEVASNKERYKSRSNFIALLAEKNFFAH
ncbi:type II toxin-antitoxin system HicB family antitoxin [Psychrobacter immobilis]|uniref:type II toxin-antitoxin system HicB family antitoxin n=1 Tax=Psychrobacter immobilis TaxID=498 RepID=UPI00191A6068|nr:type II toxin-antitoxin system HicB family antitoxin [Psychrobacter immobilis]|tara:strand:+ start:132 stop:542 length:411 start_codon:yes stop_codon:yes gene_type:complete